MDGAGLVGVVILRIVVFFFTLIVGSVVSTLAGLRRCGAVCEVVAGAATRRQIHTSNGASDASARRFR